MDSVDLRQGYNLIKHKAVNLIIEAHNWAIHIRLPEEFNPISLFLKGQIRKPSIVAFYIMYIPVFLSLKAKKLTASARFLPTLQVNEIFY
jgi:hypothetical protein